VERLVTFVLEPGGRPRVKAKTADIAGEWNDCCLLDLNHDGQLEVMLPNGVQKIWDIPVWTIDPQGRFHDSQVSNVGCDQVENYAFTTWCGAWGLADFGHTGHWSVETVWPVGAEQNFTLAHCYSFDAQTSSWQPSTRRFAGHYATQTAFYRQLWPALKVFEQRTDIGLPPNPATCMAFRGQSYALSSCETPADEIDQALRQVNSFFESGPESPPQ